MFATFAPARRLRAWLAPIALGGLAAVAVAQDAPKAEKKLTPAEQLDHKILDEIRNNSEIMKNLGYISDVIGHRLTGSKSLERANNYTKEVMESYGLENCHLEPWEVPLGWQRGFVTMKMIEPREVPIIACSNAWQPGTKGKVTGPVVIVEARTKEDLEKYKGKLKNAVVIQSPPRTIAPVTDNSYLGRPGTNGTVTAPRPAPPAPPATTPPGSPPPPAADKPKTVIIDEVEPSDGEQPPATQPPTTQPPAGAQPPAGGRGGRGGFGGSLVNIAEFLREEGAAATISDSGKPHGLLVTGGGWGRTADGKAPPDGVASLTLTHEHYALLYRLAKDGKNPKIELEVKNTFIPGPITVYNTVGEIKGSEKPDEVVVVGAHLDSWDLGSGTTDNGTGSCVTLEVARSLGKLAKQGYRPKRTIRFVLFSGEEQGLHGSKQYCIRHKDEMDKHSLAVVHDTGTGRVINLGVLGREEMRKAFSPELTTLKAVNFEGLVSGGMAGGTDHASFNGVGVPGMACYQDADEYRYTHHTQSDTLDKAKHPNLIQGAQVLAVVATRAANFPTLMPRERASGSESPGGRGGRGGRGGATPPPPPPVEKKDEKKPPQ
jgi:carboxypeptidase Q